MEYSPTIVTTHNTEGGNTSTPSVPSSMRRCCFTLNNYTEETLTKIIDTCNTNNHKYSIGREVGASGTPHLQGYLEFKGPRVFNTIKKLLPGAHIERARGSRLDNIRYTQKENNYETNFPTPLKDLCLKEYEHVTWRKWQADVVALYDETPDPRKIHWYVDIEGNNGKSFLTRYMVLKHGVLVASGKKQDIFHAIAKRLEDPTDYSLFKMVILDIPRHSAEFVNYGLLEEIKNGLIFSGKYEGGTFAFPIPHLLIFANMEPDYNKFSLDRWIIHKF